VKIEKSKLPIKLSAGFLSQFSSRFFFKKDKERSRLLYEKVQKKSEF